MELQMRKEKIYIFDTTIRDGAQTEGVNFSIEEKNKIAEKLSYFTGLTKEYILKSNLRIDRTQCQ